MFIKTHVSWYGNNSVNVIKQTYTGFQSNLLLVIFKKYSFRIFKIITKLSVVVRFSIDKNHL